MGTVPVCACFTIIFLTLFLLWLPYGIGQAIIFLPRGFLSIVRGGYSNLLSSGIFPRYFSVSFLVCTYILLLGAVQAGDAAGRRGSTHLCFSSVVTRSPVYCPRAIVFRLCASFFPQKNMRVRQSSKQFACAREFRAGELSSIVPRSSTIDFEQCSSTTDFEQSRRSELKRDVREEPRAVCCVPLFGGRHGADPTRRCQQHRTTGVRRHRVRRNERAMPSSTSRPYRERRLLLCFAVDRGTETWSLRPTSTVLRRRAADHLPLSLKLLKLPLSRVLSSMLRLYVVCLVCYF